MALGKECEALSKKQPEAKRVETMDQVIESLPSKHKVLGSNSSTAKIKNKTKYKKRVCRLIANSGSQDCWIPGISLVTSAVTGTLVRGRQTLDGGCASQGPNAASGSCRR
jgi:hypothetical protein